jgi:hypothetical protein
MAYDRFMIAPMATGLETDQKPWLIPEDAFSRLNNAYIFRGRVRKKYGTQLMNENVSPSVAPLYSRLRINVGTLGSGNASGTVPGVIFNQGQLFSIGANIFTVQALGTPVDMLVVGTASTAWFNTTTGVFTFTGVAAADTTPVYWYPSQPVTGLITYQTNKSSLDPVYAFDTQFSYQYNLSGSGAWDVLGPVPPAAGSGIWTGADYQLFWGVTWQGETADIRYLFVTNNHRADGIQYWNGTIWQTLFAVTAFNLPSTIGTTNGSGNFTGTQAGGALGQAFIIGGQTFTVTTATLTSPYPLSVTGTGSGTGTYNIISNDLIFTGAAINKPIVYYTVSSTLATARMLVVFKNHLIALSPTLSTGDSYRNMAMWAAFGDPTAPNAWNNSVPGQGNNLVASTMEDIVSCEFVKDRLIVFFERSTYEFAYTGNYANPFQWNQLNTELGTESTFSVVPFDRICLAIGNVGIHSCNGQNVERIDNKIPDTIWNIRTGYNQINRVYGIRDYFAEQVYWTYPYGDDDQHSAVYPNKILCYNYKTGSWAQFDDSITVFGYYYAAPQTAITWESQDVLWDNDNITWDGGTGQALNQLILAGNQEGFVFVVNSEYSSNDPSLQMTNLLLDGNNNVVVTAISHNFNVGDYVYLTNINGLIGPFVGFYQIIQINTADTFIIQAQDLQSVLIAGSVYLGGGNISRVQQIDIYTKQLNLYIKDDRNAAIARVDFLVDKTASSEITVDCLLGTSSQGTIAGARATQTLLGNNVLTTSPYNPLLYPNEQYQDRLWHPVYMIAEGNAVQFRIYQTSAQDVPAGQVPQLANPSVFFQDFQMHAMTIYSTKTSSRAQ